MTGTRYYSIGSVTVATRTGASSVAFVAGDTQGTDSVAIDSQALTVTHRYYDPYGNPRGTAPPSFPVGEKGFVGGVDDTATGLTNLGVREYQPGSGSFISPDPLLNPYDPQDLNAYTYAADNPSTNSDPSGAMMISGGSPGCVGSKQAVEACNTKAQAEDPTPKGYSPPPGSGTTRFCDGYTCASIPSWHEHPDNPAAHKPAPVTRPSPRPSCNPMSIHLGTCIDTTGAGSGVATWFRQNWLPALIVGVSLVCTFVTRGETKASICDDSAALDDSATAPTGRRGSPMEVPRGTNMPAEIDGISYGGHALDEMQSEGFTPSIESGRKVLSTDERKEASEVLDELRNAITVY